MPEVKMPGDPTNVKITYSSQVPGEWLVQFGEDTPYRVFDNGPILPLRNGDRIVLTTVYALPPGSGFRYDGNNLKDSYGNKLSPGAKFIPEITYTVYDVVEANQFLGTIDYYTLATGNEQDTSGGLGARNLTGKLYSGSGEPPPDPKKSSPRPD